MSEWFLVSPTFFFRKDRTTPCVCYSSLRATAATTNRSSTLPTAISCGWSLGVRERRQSDCSR